MSGCMAVPSNVMPVSMSTPTPSMWNCPSHVNMSVMKASRALWLPSSSSRAKFCANAYAGEGGGGGLSGGGAVADANRSMGSSASVAMRIIAGRVGE